jgi:hypothetical protein
VELVKEPTTSRAAGLLVVGVVVVAAAVAVAAAAASKATQLAKQITGARRLVGLRLLLLRLVGLASELVEEVHLGLLGCNVMFLGLSGGYRGSLDANRDLESDARG